MCITFEPKTKPTFIKPLPEKADLNLDKFERS